MRRVGAEAADELSPSERASGEWVSEEDVLARVPSLTSRALEGRRLRGSLRAKPLEHDAAGRPRKYWYRTTEIDALVAEVGGVAAAPPGAAAYAMDRLELELARVEVRELELANAQRELADVRAENARLTHTIDALLRALQTAVGTPTPTTLEPPPHAGGNATP